MLWVLVLLSSVFQSTLLYPDTWSIGASCFRSGPAWTVTVPTSIQGLATNTSHTDCYIQKKKRKKPSRLFLEVQKPIVDIQMDKSTPSTSVFSSGVSNPDPGFCPQGILITPLHSRQTPPPRKAGPNQYFSGGMGKKEGSPMSPVAIFLRQKEEGFLFGGESSTVASLCLCAADCAWGGSQ